MAEFIHKYYCEHCRQYIFGDTAAMLAMGVNLHNSAMHPADFSTWTAGGIVLSTRYSGPGFAALPQYTKPFGTTSRSEGGDTKLPQITKADRELLAKGHVRWD